MEDKRFAHISTDPKFRRIPKHERKVKIDKRFQSMFTDNDFKVKYTIDKRGRPFKHSTTEDLKRYYDLESDSEENSSENEEESENQPEESDNQTVKSDNQTEQLGKFVKAPQNDLNVKLKSDKKLTDDIKNKLRNLNVDYARGESTLLSESSSDDDEDDDDDDAGGEAGLSEDEDIEHKWGQLDTDADKTDEATYRLAACNMNWDRIRAIDLMVLFNSFLPPGGAIKSVTIYLSEFGKKRITEEEVKGPIELVEKKEGEDEYEENEKQDDENEEGSKFHMEKLRQYQLNRLKYYYAVISFDNANAANKVYTECDGMEYESSATKIDLRFIPDYMTFDESDIKETCDKLPELNKYMPRFFTTTALQQAKVDLTWDETDLERIEMSQKLNSGKIDDICKNDLENYLALSSSDEEDDDNKDEDKESGESDDDKEFSNPIDKYKALLQDIENKEKEKENNKIEMEVSWGINLKNKTEDLVEKKLMEDEDKTPFQKYLDKKREKRKERKQKQKTKDEDNIDSDVPSDIDMNDPYFAEEFNDKEFKKPTNSKKKTSNKNADNSPESEEDENSKAQLELLLMDEKEDGKKHFNLKSIQQAELNGTKKNKRKKMKNKDEEGKVEDNFEVNVNDERFSALFTSHHFNIDPTDPHYKKTKAMEKLVQEVIKRRGKNDLETNSNSKEESEKVANQKKNAELNVLVKSVKRKTEALYNSNKKKKKQN